MQSIIKGLLSEYYSPVQISGRLKLALGVEISHEAIYKHIWEDKRIGGDLHNFLRIREKGTEPGETKKTTEVRSKMP